MSDVVMPRLSDSMEEGTVLKWLKQPGDEVAVGDELVEIETDKANMVYEADTAGTLTEIVAQEGDTLPIGEVIARVGDASEVKAPSGDGAGDGAASPEKADRGDSGSAAPPPAPSAEPAQAAPQPTTTAAPPQPAAPAPPAPRSDGDGRVKASPIAKRIAKDRGLDLHGLSGSGPGGRIVKADVEKALAGGVAPAPAPTTPAAPAVPAGPTAGAREKPETAKGETTVVELTKLQQTVARRMAESKATAPHFYLQAEFDMTSAVEGRKRLKESAKEGEVVPTFNDMVMKACAIALREHPRANGAYRDGKIELYSRVNVGVAVAAQDALVVPTVFDADLKGLREIATETKALAARVRDGSITPPELSGGTFTVSNLGMYGISNFQAVINTPQAGILAVGELKAKPVVTDGGAIEARQMMGVTLACDHRILYGADGAIFLKRVRELLEAPFGLSLSTEAIDVPIDSLPEVDEHSVELAADPDRAWEALVETLPRAFDTRLSRRGARLLRCTYLEAQGEPSVIGSTLPGFIISRSVRPSTLALLGQHRFSRYALVFLIDELGRGRSRVRAETRAEFPGIGGRLYRTAVIGSRGHVRAVRRVLAAVGRRADRSAARLDRAALLRWVEGYERAWRTEGTAPLNELFATDASYSTAPYERPHLGLDAIARMWEAERHGPDEVFQLRTEILAVEGDTGVVRVEVYYGEPRNQEYRDLWILRLDAEGRCIHFEEWPFWPPGTEGTAAAGG